MGKIKIILGLVCLLFAGLTAGYAGALGSGESDEARIEKVVHVYTSQIGVRELTGRNDGAQVEQYLASTGFKKGAPWCAAFVTWCFDQAGIKTVASAWSPAWFPPGNTIFHKGKFTKSKPRQADVFGIYFAKQKRIAHVGFIDRWGSDYVITVEGNTNRAGSREGDGVYKKRRPTSAIFKVSRWIGNTSSGLRPPSPGGEGNTTRV